MRRFFAVLLAFGLMSPTFAAAIEGWVAGAGQMMGSSGNTFAGLDAPMAGAQGGLGVGHFGMWGEALMTDSDRYYFSLNLGADFRFGRKTRLDAGLFTGPVYFHVARQPAPTLDLSALTKQQRRAIQGSVPGGLERVSDEVDSYSEDEAQLKQYAVGWNLLRLRVAAERALGAGLFLGLGGQVGYHLILTGEDAAAGAKNDAVDQISSQYALTDEVAAAVRDAVGARPVAASDLGGFDYAVETYLKFEF